MKRLRYEIRIRCAEEKYAMMLLGMVPGTAPIEITLSGTDLAGVMVAAEDLKMVIEDIPGADNVRLSVEEGNPEYRVIPDQDKMQRLGMNTAYVRMNLRTALTGNDRSEERRGGKVCRSSVS